MCHHLGGVVKDRVQQFYLLLMFNSTEQAVYVKYFDSFLFNTVHYKKTTIHILNLFIHVPAGKGEDVKVPPIFSTQSRNIVRLKQICQCLTGKLLSD